MRSTSRPAWSPRRATRRAGRLSSRWYPSELRLYPVGRLDIDTTGLILLTNDGELAHRLTHPSFEVQKTYRAGRRAVRPVSESALRALRAGVELDDGRTAPGARPAARRRHARADDPRGPQAPGQADVRARRPSGQTPGADRVRAARAGWPTAGRLPAAERRRGRRPHGRWVSSSSCCSVVSVNARATSAG